MVVCPRCQKMKPQIIIGERASTICPKCGNFRINVKETIEIQKPDEAEVAEELPADGEPETTPGFEGVDQMEEEEVRKLARRLKIANWWNRNVDDLKQLVKESLQ